ncbi:DUF1837 domain-containing protein [Salmonella enterica subsp. enterica serovar Alachua]|nr:DUF1837 domain-containing protein [Salmonella enterica]EAQ2307733.1 DUF1837 domain-containing protein [Salmonella enterica subsp. enterica serovar Alachua]ECG9859340.1 DUF1837 domain-containing protein [Salmonella enterica subsp. enterica]EAP2282150.1 DUF1837 domain-containing protein [Salmonella enterica]EAR1832746.1 DUF1837 domain-containing protein [Salmonella enterica subsp. enterica serovar Alachua]
MDDISRLLEIEWSDLIEANHSWISNCLISSPETRKNKITARFYSVPYAGLQQDLTQLAERFADSIEEYVFDSITLAEMKRNGIKPFRKAAEFFGNTNPIVDGKYGELILYILSEFVLKTPMVTHKITSLTNVNDQVKGGDGVFFGTYNGGLSILIGEAKIYADFSQGLDSIFDSLNRFNGSYSGNALRHEMFIARSNISKNFDIEDLELIYKAFTPGSTVYNACLKTHPVLLVFQDDRLTEIENEAMSIEEVRTLYDSWLANKINDVCDIISDKYIKYPAMKSYFLEFFLLPMRDVTAFKNSLYQSIHAVPYVAPLQKKKISSKSKAAGAKKTKTSIKKDADNKNA